MVTLVALAICAICLGVRWVLMVRFPLLLTNDSTDYLLAAQRIADELDFFNQGLRDWRLPGYPVLLAMVHRIAGAGLAAVEAAQAVLGLGSVIAALVLARVVGLGLPGTAVVGLFVGLHPILLLFEHTVMSEAALSLFLMASAAGLCASLNGRLGLLPNLLVGLLVGATLLIRSNSIFFLGGLAVALCWLETTTGRQRPEARKRLARCLLGIAAGALLVLTPWIVRNQIHLGKPTPFAGNTQRALLLYHAQHGLLDPDLPLMRGRAWDEGDLNASAYGLLDALNRASRPEHEARAILVEQMRSHPFAYARQVIWSAGHWVGLPAPLAAYGRRDLSYWIGSTIADLPRLEQHNQRLLQGLPGYTTPMAPGREGRGLRVWRSASLRFLQWGRPLLAAAFLLSVLALFHRFRSRRSRPRAEVPRTAHLGLAFGVALIFSIGCHAILLADYDRFAVPYDVFLAVVVCLAFATIRPGDRTAVGKAATRITGAADPRPSAPRPPG